MDTQANIALGRVTADQAWTPYEGSNGGDRDWTALVKRLAKGEGAGFEELYDALNGFRLYFVRRLGTEDGEDAYHDLIVRLVVQIRRGDLKESRRVLGYARVIATRIVINAHATAPVDTMELFDNIVDPFGNTLDPESIAIRRQEEEAATRILASLQPKHREVLLRFYVNGEPAEAIQASLGLTKTQFQLLKCRAKARFVHLCQQRIGQRGASGRTEPARSRMRASDLAISITQECEPTTAGSHEMGETRINRCVGVETKGGPRKVGCEAVWLRTTGHHWWLKVPKKISKRRTVQIELADALIIGTVVSCVGQRGAYEMTVDAKKYIPRDKLPGLESTLP
jgi:RNA polymerase sigma-70 factor (ECF subfamily)